jgi:hypothetical protein
MQARCKESLEYLDINAGCCLSRSEIVVKLSYLLLLSATNMEGILMSAILAVIVQQTIATYGSNRLAARTSHISRDLTSTVLCTKLGE